MSDILPKGTALPVHYVLDGTVGSGRVRTVYAAHDAEGHRAAASVLHEDLVEPMGEWFENAAILGRTLDHPNLVKTLALGHLKDDRPVVLTELLEGETLAEILASRTHALGSIEVARIVTQLGAALDYLHERSPMVVHRALTPENVFLADPDARVKLLEVGSHDRPRFAPARAIHRSPEELAGLTELSPRADVFSLASLTYELLTAQPAFAGNANSVLDAIRSGQRPRVSDQREELSGRVDEVLLRAWSLSPEARQQSAGAFARALSEALTEPTDPVVHRHPQRAQPLRQSRPPDEPPAPAPARARSASAPEEANPMEEFPTVKLVIGTGGAVSVSSAIRPETTARTPMGALASAPTGAPSGASRSFSQPFRAAPRGGPRSVIPPPAAPVGPDSAPQDQDVTSRDIHPKSQSSQGAVADDPTPTLDAVVPMDPTPTAVVQTVSGSALAEAETPSIVVASSASRLSPMGVTAPNVPPSVGQRPIAPPPLAAPPAAPLAYSPPPPPVLSSVPPAAPLPLAAPPPPSAPSPLAAPPPPLAPSPPVHYVPPEVVSNPEPRPLRAFQDEPTESFSLPPKPRADRSPLVLAAAFIANAILIVGIAHALAWGSRLRATPIVIQGASPVCAPCAACPAVPLLPECQPAPSPPRSPVARPALPTPPRPALQPRPAALRPIAQPPGPAQPLRVLAPSPATPP